MPTVPSDNNSLTLSEPDEQMKKSNGHGVYRMPKISIFQGWVNVNKARKKFRSKTDFMDYILDGCFIATNYQNINCIFGGFNSLRPSDAYMRQ